MGSYSFEFTTTACNRPDVLERTYKALHTHLLGVDYGSCVLHLNVDPVPTAQDIGACVDVAKKYFGVVNLRTPDKPSFSSAVKWTWSQVQGSFFFNLEDDWTLIKDIHAPSMVDRLLKYKELEHPSSNHVLQVGLRRSRRKVWKKNAAPLMLAPSLIWAPIGRDVFAKNLPDDFRGDPEVRLKKSLGPTCRCELWGSVGEAYMVDIGRSWRAEKGINRDVNNPAGYTWTGPK
jgi:hypothetical protein